MAGARHAPERDLHERFTAWLLQGAADEPARDLALHAAFCPECGAHMAALDLLPLVDTGRAPMPPSRRGAAPVKRAAFRPGLAWAVAAGLVIVAAGGFALTFGRLSLLPGASPAQQVLGGFGGGHLSSATSAPSASPGESTAASPPEASSSGPTIVEPAASLAASVDSGSSVPSATDPEPTKSPRPRSTATATASPTATALPTPSPLLALCANLADDDGDGLVDLEDPGCTGPLDNDETDP